MSILKTPLQIKNIELNNRLVMPPMATAKSGDDGRVTQQLLQYYDEKTQGGYIGLVITEHSFISQEGKASRGQLSISRDEDIDGLSKLAATIHKNHSKAIAQINHAGGAAKEEVTGCPPLSASAVRFPRADAHAPFPKEMSREDINKVIRDFADAARRVKDAGFDGVELHSAHAYLLNQFYSPLVNKRNDAYCGYNIEGRLRLHLEVIQAVRQAVGEDYLVALRLGASDYMPGGSTIEDSVLAAKEFEKAGIDLLDISGGFCFYTNPLSKEQGYFNEITDRIKRNVSIPVILTGGITQAQAAEKLLQEKRADLIGVGRAILKDSLWAEKTMKELV